MTSELAQHAMVIGAAGGIGRCVAESLGARRLSVTGIDMKESTLQDQSYYSHLRLDMSRPESIGAALDAVPHSETFCVINVAGGAYVEEVNQSRSPDFALGLLEETIGANFTTSVAAIMVAQAVASSRESRDVSVTLCSSINAIGNYEYPIYSAAKGAVESLVHSQAVPLGRQGIRINAIRLGTVVTETSRRLHGEAGNEHYEKLLDMAALGRFVTTQEAATAFVAAAVCLTGMTGVVIPVDAGQSVAGHRSLPRASRLIATSKAQRPRCNLRAQGGCMDLGTQVALTVLQLALGAGLAALARWTQIRLRTRNPAARIWCINRGKPVQIVVSQDDAADPRELIVKVYAADYLAAVETKALMSDILHVRNVNLLTSGEFHRSMFTQNLVCVGGPVNNRITRQILQRMTVPVHFDGYTVVSDFSGQRYEAEIDQETHKITRDFGVAILAKNPFDPDSSVALLMGARTFGVAASARILSSGSLRKMHATLGVEYPKWAILDVDVIDDFVARIEVVESSTHPVRV